MSNTLAILLCQQAMDEGFRVFGCFVFCTTSAICFHYQKKVCYLRVLHAVVMPLFLHE